MKIDLFKKTKYSRAWKGIFASLFLFIPGIVVSANAGVLLQSQNSTNGASFSSYTSLDGSVVTEAADDFIHVADIDKITFTGRTSSAFYTEAVYLRFYSADANGGPGTLLQEYFLNKGDPNLTIGPDYVVVVLPTIFQATGHHFVSVQIV
ncbi:MAG: hypothetical protein OEX19_08740, partial [Gammaproteobacteria bacterium]|nr:hypothetical protein [Gammaproteobacteria bacterium]